MIKENKLSNYIPVNRKLFEHILWCEERPFSKFEAWIDLMQRARFEDSEAKALIGGKLIKWNRGEVPVSLRFLADKWKWSKNKVDDYFKMLELDRMILKRTQEGTSQTIVKLCNYESYNVKVLSTGQQKGQRGDNEGTVKGQRGDKSNKDNKENNEEDTGAVAPEYSHDDLKKFKAFQDWILRKAPNVAKLNEPFTIEQYFKLKNIFDPKTIGVYILKMHNWKPLLKNNISAYMTLLNWVQNPKNELAGQNVVNPLNEALINTTKTMQTT